MLFYIRDLVIQMRLFIPMRLANNKLVSNSRRFNDALPEPPPLDFAELDALDTELATTELLLLLDTTLELTAALDCELLSLLAALLEVVPQVSPHRLSAQSGLSIKGLRLPCHC